MPDQRKTPQSVQASPDLAALGKALLGAWQLSGEAEGLIRYEWTEGGLFLKQFVDLVVFGKHIKGLEVIGHLHRVGEEPSPEIWSRFYSYSDGLTLDYVYELQGRDITIWSKQKNSNNRFQGSFSENGAFYSGAWAWPGGGYRV